MKYIAYVSVFFCCLTYHVSAQEVATDTVSTTVNKVIAAEKTTNEATEEITVDKIVAVVGKNIIKMSDIETSITQMRMLKGVEAGSFDSRCQTFEGYLVNKMLLQQAYLDSVQVSDDYVNSELDMRLKGMIAQYGSKEALEREAGKTVAELKDQYRDVYRENMMIQQEEQKVTGSVKITPKEVTDFFNKIPKDSVDIIPTEYEFCEIVKMPDISMEERERVRLQLNQLRERIVKGEKFSTLAALYSEDPGSSKKGGELGFFSRGDMVSEFEGAAFMLKPGEVSPVIETKYGFHIIQLIERRGDMVNARHILLIPKVSLQDLQKSRQFLDSVANLIKNRTYTFEEAAVLFSDAPTKSSGGIITNPQTLSSKFTERIAKEYLQYDISKLKEHDISSIIAMKDHLNKDGYKILYVKSKVREHRANMTDDYNKIYDAALKASQNANLLKWCEKRKDNIYIKIMEPYDQCSFQIDWENKKGKK